ncbi:unnamed protein product, partial [Ectocarpus sp. 8 AP-2014]
DVSPGSTLDLQGIKINNCSGSAIRTDSSALTVRNCIFENNSNASRGGAVLASNSDVAIESTVFSRNVANQGGSVYVTSDSRRRTASVLTGNYATQSGGGISTSENSTLTVSDCRFDSNTAAKFGAGVSGPNMDIRNCTFTDNTSDQDGGGLYTWGVSEIDDVVCEYNVALDKGG